MSKLLKFDELISRSRPIWIGLGQLGICLLGVHLAADRLDDAAYQGMVWATDQLSPLLSKLSIDEVPPDLFVKPAAWLAVLIEFVVDAYIFACLALTAHEPELSWARYKRNLSVQAVVVPLFWVPVALAGTWMVGMAVEDLIAPFNESAALGASWLMVAVVAWRLGFTGLRRVIGATDSPKHWYQGAVWAPLLLLVAALAAWYGLPIRGLGALMAGT